MKEIEIRSIVLRGKERRPVKKLAGFEKHHSLPQRADAYHNGWIGKIAAADLEEEINDLVGLLRRQLGLKRADFEAHVDGAAAVVRTSQFEFTVSVALVEGNLSEVCWTRELTPLEHISALKAPGVNEVFGDQLSEIDLQLVHRAEIQELIDAFEEKGLDVDYPYDCTSCKITLPDAGVVEVKQPQ